jgi:hypothetical protein
MHQPVDDRMPLSDFTAHTINLLLIFDIADQDFTINQQLG